MDRGKGGTIFATFMWTSFMVDPYTSDRNIFMRIYYTVNALNTKCVNAAGVTVLQRAGNVWGFHSAGSVG